ASARSTLVTRPLRWSCARMRKSSRSSLKASAMGTVLERWCPILPCSIQSSPHLGLRQHIVQRAAQAHEELVHLVVAERECRREAEDRIAEATEGDAVAVGGSEQPVGQR